MCKLFVIAKFNILLLKTKNPDNIVLKWKIIQKRKKAINYFDFLHF